MAGSAPTELKPLAAILAWVFPGLGHISNGERRRGFLVMFGILFLFVSGLLIGGIDSVDHRNDRLWFVAQAVCGPITIGADMLNQRLVQAAPERWKSDQELAARYAQGDEAVKKLLRREGVGRMNELGTLFIALAGLMNLVVILDALAPGSYRHGAGR